MATTMKAWRISSSGPIASTLSLHTDVPKPAISSPCQVLVRIAHAGLNPADFKVPALGLISRAVVSYPHTPGLDGAGIVEAVGAQVTDLKRGDAVAVFSPMDAKDPGTLGEYTVVPRSEVAKIDDQEVAGGAKGDDAGDSNGSVLRQTAGLAAVGMTAYQALRPHVKKGSRVFLNGGSGGVGTTGIQLAKILGAEQVTVSCSTAKIDLCRSLGADKIIDYKTQDVVSELTKEGQVYDVVMDNVGHSPDNLANKAHQFTKPDAVFIFIGGSSKAAKHLLTSMILPGFAGGSKRKTTWFHPKPDQEAFQQLATWVHEAKLRIVIDKTFKFDQVKEAYGYLEQGSCTGKIIIDQYS